ASAQEGAIARWGGITNACMAGVFLMVARYGIQGVLDFKKLWRPAVFLSMLCLTTTGGYRGVIIVIAVTLILVFCLEGLLRVMLLPAALLGMMLCATLVVSFSE